VTFERKSINEIKRPMNNDYLEVENQDGMPGLVDSTIALEFLITAKSGIRNAAAALTEIEDPEARKAIHGMLNDAIDLHAQVSDLMIKKGWFHPYNVKEQFKLDAISSKTAVRIAELELFPGNTSRLGTFATPNY
jgi:similar to spore coat protein